MRGRFVSLPPSRRAAIDLLRFSVGVPTVTAVRRMNLSAVAQARAQSAARTRWITIFLKACALVAREFPPLRQVYLPWPWPHFYEYPTSVGMIVIDRELDGKPFQFSYTDRRSGVAIAHRHRRQRSRGPRKQPVESIRDFRLAARFIRLPFWLRRPLLWLAYNIGRQRARYFGTYGVTTPPPENSPPRVSLWTTRLNYGRVGSDGITIVDVTVDHRVLDGVTGARVLARMEDILNGAIADELRGQPRCLNQRGFQ